MAALDASEKCYQRHSINITPIGLNAGSHNIYLCPTG